MLGRIPRAGNGGWVFSDRKHWVVAVVCGYRAEIARNWSEWRSDKDRRG